MYCSKCGAYNPDHFNYCDQCGAPLSFSPQSPRAPATFRPAAPLLQPTRRAPLTPPGPRAAPKA